MTCTSTRIVRTLVFLTTVTAVLAVQSAARAEVAELDRLTSRYKAEAQAALRPVQRRYVYRLEELKRNLTRADRLKDALEVKKEIERVEGVLAPKHTAADATKDKVAPEGPGDVDPKDAYIHEGVGWKGFRVGATREEPIAFMGKPDNPGETRWLQWKRKHNMHCLLDDTRGAFELRFDRECRQRLKNGIRIGTSEKKVRGEYGEPTSAEDRGRAKKLIYGQKGILFWFYDGDVSQIVVFRPH